MADEGQHNKGHNKGASTPRQKLIEGGGRLRKNLRRPHGCVGRTYQTKASMERCRVVVGGVVYVAPGRFLLQLCTHTNHALLFSRLPAIYLHTSPFIVVGCAKSIITDRRVENASQLALWHNHIQQYQTSRPTDQAIDSLHKPQLQRSNATLASALPCSG